jgi:beta-phosphoglucomutase-like phosphatase (HAD superfamily)
VTVLVVRFLGITPHACLAHENTDDGVAAAVAAGMDVIDIRHQPRR